MITILALIAVVLITYSCTTMPSKQWEGNLEVWVEPVKENDRQLFPSLYVDDKFVGSISDKKPILYLKRGEYKVRLELPGYKTWEQTIHILREPSQQFLYVNMQKE